MPTIDTSAIEGYETMTPDQKIEALTKFEYQDYASELAKTKEDFAKAKTAMDKAFSELAEKKRQDKAKMSESDAMIAELRDALAQSREAVKAVTEQLEEQQKINQIATYKNSYLSLGYEDKLAEETAKAMVEGNMAKVFENQKKAAEAAEKRIKDELTRKDPRPGGAGGGSEAEKSEADKIAERIAKERAGADAKSKDILSKFVK